MPLFDTHAHLDHESFDGRLDEVLQRAREHRVGRIITIGVDATSSRRCVKLAAEHPLILSAAVGIQPNYVAQMGPDAWEQIEALAAQPGVVAIGETGLDRYWDDCPFELQWQSFQRHLELAAKRELPVIIHMRDCGPDILQAIRPFATSGRLRGVMHSFTGDCDLMEQCLAANLHISFAGMVTYKKSSQLREVAARVPDNRLLIETDSPYLPPEPLRHRRPNEPANLVHTAQCLADARGSTLQELIRLTFDNAQRLFMERSTVAI
jgi:TatD DNase family protein